MGHAALMLARGTLPGPQDMAQTLPCSDTDPPRHWDRSLPPCTPVRAPLLPSPGTGRTPAPPAGLPSSWREEPWACAPQLPSSARQCRLWPLLHGPQCCGEGCPPARADAAALCAGWGSCLVQGQTHLAGRATIARGTGALLHLHRLLQARGMGHGHVHVDVGEPGRQEARRELSVCRETGLGQAAWAQPGPGPGRGLPRVTARLHRIPGEAVRSVRVTLHPGASVRGAVVSQAHLREPRRESPMPTCPGRGDAPLPFRGVQSSFRRELPGATHAAGGGNYHG